MLSFRLFLVLIYRNNKNVTKMNNYFYIKEYLPKRYMATIEQEQDRDMCYAFKNGILTDTMRNLFLDKIKEITHNQKEGWTICFIPASSTQNTLTRFKNLAVALNNAGYNVEQKAIYNTHDKESGYLTGKSGNPIDGFGFDDSKIFGRNILLIDDIITRGTTFELTANALKSIGAKSVTGLFLAKTINPDFHTSYIPEEDYDEPDYYEERTYECYNGSYAQDVEGWSDQDIDDVFDGDPEAYWNID